MSAVNSDPSTTAANEGLNLAPQRSEGGERAKVAEATSLCISMNEAARKKWDKAVDPERLKLELIMWHTSQAAYALSNLHREL